MDKCGPDDLTDRERDVLALLRRDFTNEQIAQRLGISLDGAKYHVSQILSKLGVATREEAATWRTGERRAWWARWPVWARIAGAATVVAAAAGLAVLVFGGGQAEEEPSATNLTVRELYDEVGQAITRPGMVLHTQIRPQESNGLTDSSASLEYWIDKDGDRARLEIPTSDDGTEITPVHVIVTGDKYYRSGGTGPVETNLVEDHADFCPDSADPLVSALLWCAGSGTPSAGETLDSRLEIPDHEGRPVIVLVVDGTSVITLSGGILPAPTGGTVPPPLPERSVQYRNTSRTYVDANTFLPIERQHEIREDGTFHDASTFVYSHEFISADDLPSDFFDPSSLEPASTP